ncbi:DUF4192 family protein [Rhodococcus koreensis]|uniref:DUF4192 family protein n=1 Tax=Rhodococcus koreensis TaxID=99653 RepID=UPI00367326E8
MEDANAATVHIARHLRGVARAHVLTIAGLFALIGGHGVEARIACERADSAADRHQLGMKLLRLLKHSIGCQRAPIEAHRPTRPVSQPGYAVVYGLLPSAVVASRCGRIGCCAAGYVGGEQRAVAVTALARR